MNVARQEGLHLRERLTREVLRAQNGGVDAAHHILQKSERAVALGDDSLPVPLVHIERVEIVELLIGANGVHVGVDAVARLHLVFSQRQALPFGQRVNHLSAGLTHVLDGEGNGALHTVEIVVDTQTLQHKEGGGNTAQTQLRGEILLKEFLDLLNAQLGLACAQKGLVNLGLYHFAHGCYAVFLRSLDGIITLIHMQR